MDPYFESFKVGAGFSFVLFCTSFLQLEKARSIKKKDIKMKSIDLFINQGDSMNSENARFNCASEVVLTICVM